MLYGILKQHLNNGEKLSPLQESTWKKLFNKAEKSPKDLTPLEAFQVGRLTQKAIERNNEFGGAEMEDETKYLEKLQTNIKVNLL